MITEHGRELGLPDGYGVKEVAQVLGVAKSNLWSIRDLPDPVYQFESGRVWVKDEIDEFARVYNDRREARLARGAA